MDTHGNSQNQTKSEKQIRMETIMELYAHITIELFEEQNEQINNGRLKRAKEAVRCMDIVEKEVEKAWNRCW